MIKLGQTEELSNIGFLVASNNIE